MSENTLDRELNIANNRDAEGREWKIHMKRGSSLCHTRPDPDRSDAVIPKNMQGEWTKPSLLRTQINKYLNESWDNADKARVAAERKAQASKENAKKNDTGKAA